MAARDVVGALVAEACARGSACADAARPAGAARCASRRVTGRARRRARSARRPTRCTSDCVWRWLDCRSRAAASGLAPRDSPCQRSHRRHRHEPHSPRRRAWLGAAGRERRAVLGTGRPRTDLPEQADPDRRALRGRRRHRHPGARAGREDGGRASARPIIVDNKPGARRHHRHRRGRQGAARRPHAACCR